MNHRRSWILIGLCLAVLLPSAGAARGAEPTRVVLIEDPADTNILPRLRGELDGLGLAISTVAKKDDEQLPRDLIDAARKSNAVAAFRIVVAEDRADVWIADRATGKVVLREMLPRGAQIDGRVVALRAVELLRVSLMEIDVRPPAEPAPAAVALPDSSPLFEDLERVSLGADSAFLWSPGGAGPAVGVAADVSWKPTALGLRLFGGSMLAPATISLAEGTGEVTTRWIGLDAIVQPRQRRMTWRPRAGLGIAALSTALRGDANPSWFSQRGTVYTLAPRVSLDLGWALHARVRIGIGLSYLKPLRGQDVKVDDRVVATYGEHIFIADLGLALALP